MTRFRGVADQEHDKAWELLPWLVNGTLNGREQAEVEAHVRHCLPCRRELKRQEQLREAVRESPVMDRSAQQGFEALLRRVDASTNGRPSLLPDGSAGYRLRKMFGRWTELGRAAQAVYAVAGLVIVLVGLSLVYQGGTSGIYQTLSSSEPSDFLMIDVVFAPNTPASERRSLLGTLDGRAEPRGGSPVRYRVYLELEAVPAGEPIELVERLREDPRVAFAGWVPGAAPADR